MTEHRFVVQSAHEMHSLGQSLGRAARGGDVLVLSGELGAGKTTLAQGIAAGMGIIERVTSPTFVISRVHQHPSGGPDLAHVDAYRLGSIAELDDLDLDADLDRSVVVVEWGAGLADDLSSERLDIDIQRSQSADDETRTVDVRAHSPRWTAALARVSRAGADG